MKYEIVISVLDERIAGLIKENIENKLNYNCDTRPAIASFDIGEQVKLTYCNDDTIYTIDGIKLDRHFNKIYHLKDVQGWKAVVNLMAVGFEGI